MQGMQYIPTITNYTKLWWVPNVVVAHQKEGIEAIHLPTGRTLCKLSLLEGGLHADINGDGVLDHVQVHTSNTTPAFGSLAFSWIFNFYDHKYSLSTLDCRRQCWRENCSERVNGSVEALLGSGNLRRSHPGTAL
jgi:hypothetical protein